MKRFALLLFGIFTTFAATLAVPLLPACGPHGPVNWPGLGECAPEVSNIAPIVSRILLANKGGEQSDLSMADRAKDELTDLARDHGANVVSCVVQRIVSDWTSPGATQEPTRVAAAKRGESFLAEVGARPQLADSGGEE